MIQTTIELQGGPLDGQTVPFNGGSIVTVALPTKLMPPGAPIPETAPFARYRVERRRDRIGFVRYIGVHDGGGQ